MDRQVKLVTIMTRKTVDEKTGGIRQKGGVVDRIPKVVAIALAARGTVNLIPKKVYKRYRKQQAKTG